MNKKDKKQKQPVDTNKTKKIINIVTLVILLLGLMVAVDIISVSKFQKGPFFAIRTKVYNDGGTKEYYGLGYKVIKYDQEQGKKGYDIGTWGMKYTAIPTEIDLLDLAIEYENQKDETYKKYYHQYLQITGDIYEIDNKNHSLVVRYPDPDKKYTLDVEVKLYDKKTDLSSYKSGQSISFVGTLTSYKDKTEEKPNRLVMSDCFIKN